MLSQEIGHVKTTGLLTAIAGLTLAGYADAASITITEATVFFDGTSTERIVPDNLTVVDDNAELLSFVAEGTEYSELTFVNNVSTPDPGNDYRYGVNGDDPGSQVAAVTGNRLDSGIFSLKSSAILEFASAPTSLSDVFFLFDYGSLDTTVSVQLTDGGVDIGDAVLMANMAQLGAAQVDPNAGNNLNINGVAIRFNAFVTDIELLSVDGFRVTSNDQVDPTIAGWAVPEPGSLALLGLGGLCVLRRRRG